MTRRTSISASGKIVLTLTVLLFLVSMAEAEDLPPLQGPVGPWGSAVYSCEILDGQFVGDDGGQRRGKTDTDSFWRNYRHFTFDARQGAFSTANESIAWVVTRPGNSEWDLVAHLPGGDPFYNVLRIQVWNSPKKFSLTDGMDHFSGICEAAD